MYPASPNLHSNILDVVNLVFSGIFFLEMIVKLIGIGPKNYIKDTYNIFDALIVTISVVDIIVTNTLMAAGGNTSKGPISAFRAFRLLRIFKLAKSWYQL